MRGQSAAHLEVGVAAPLKLQHDASQRHALLPLPKQPASATTTTTTTAATLITGFEGR